MKFHIPFYHILSTILILPSLPFKVNHFVHRSNVPRPQRPSGPNCIASIVPGAGRGRPARSCLGAIHGNRFAVGSPWGEMVPFHQQK